MQFLIFLIGFGLSAAQSPQRYGVGHRSLNQRRDSDGRNLGIGIHGNNIAKPNPCGPGRLPNAIGNCVEPIVTRNLFIYSAPPLPPVDPAPLPEIPNPRIDYNVVFVRTPEPHEELEPIVVPPPKTKTIVYVLTETGEVEQRVIEVPTEPSVTPEVFYVNYAEGDNPNLGGEVTLQDVLSENARQGLLLDRTYQTARPTGLAQNFPATVQTIDRHQASRPAVQTAFRPSGVRVQLRTRPSAQTSTFRAIQQNQLTSDVLEPVARRQGTIGTARESEAQLYGGNNQHSHRLDTISRTRNQERFGLNRPPHHGRIIPQH